MMGNFSGVLAILLILALLAAVVIGGYATLQFAIPRLVSLDPQVATVTLVGVATLLVISSTIASAIRGAKRKEAKSRLQAQRAVVYERCIHQWTGLLQHRKPNLFESESVKQAIASLNSALVLWGSSQVLKEYAALYRLVRDGAWDDAGLPASIEKIVLYMRQDLEQSNVGIPTGALLHLFVDTSRHDDNCVNMAIEVTRNAHRLFNSVSYQGVE